MSLNDIYTGFRTETAKNSYFTEGSHRMEYRNLGKTGLSVSEIGFGPEWMTGTPEETHAIAETLRKAGVNYLDCWMPDPHIRRTLVMP